MSGELAEAETMGGGYSGVGLADVIASCTSPVVERGVGRGAFWGCGGYMIELEGGCGEEGFPLWGDCQVGTPLTGEDC